MLLPSAEYEPFKQVVDAKLNYVKNNSPVLQIAMWMGLLLMYYSSAFDVRLLFVEGIIADVLYSSADVWQLFVMKSYQNVRSKMYVSNREKKI